MTVSQLFDTCILIDMMRQKPEAMEVLSALPDRSAISVITLQEMITGLRKREIESFENLVALFVQVDVDPAIARRSGYFTQKYLQSHRLDPNDAVIAATAEIGGYDLVTLNLKHFPMFPELQRPY